MELNEIKEELKQTDEKIKALEKQKEQLIEEIKSINRKLLYKKYELKAIEPFIKETENIDVTPIKKKIARLEFKLATQAYTLKRERQIIKKIKELQKEYEKYKHIDKARKKKTLIEQDIKKLNGRVEKIEEDLNKIRKEIKELQERRKELKKNLKREKSIGEAEYVSMEDVVIIERKDKD